MMGLLPEKAGSEKRICSSFQSKKKKKGGQKKRPHAGERPTRWPVNVSDGKGKKRQRWAKVRAPEA